MRVSCRICLLCAALVFGAGLALTWVVVEASIPKGPALNLSRVAPRPTPIADSDQVLRFAVATMVSPEQTFIFYREMVELLGERIGMSSVLCIRPSYAEVRHALTNGTVDVAFVCTGTLAKMHASDQLEILAAPEFAAGLRYRSVIIVPAASSAARIEDLRGQRFAFSDPESNTGCFVPRQMLRARGLSAETFFSETVITGSHDKSVQATARGFVAGAAVDALVLERMIRQQSRLAERVRIIWQSPAFGAPPIVAPKSQPAELVAALVAALLDLHRSAQGKAILERVGIERFVVPEPEAYDSAIALYRDLTRDQARE